MQVRGYIATVPERKVSSSGTTFFTFRLSEPFGKGEQRKVVWYDVTAFIDEVDGDLLDNRMYVEVRGRLEIEAFRRRDGEPGAAAKLLAFAVEPVQKREPA